MSLVQLFYVSRAVEPYDSESVQAILTASRRNNYRDDVTGCLLFSGCYFAQVLEGSPAVTMGRLDKISGDRRHTDFRLLVEQPITERMYGDWSMGYMHDLALEDDLGALLLDSDTAPQTLVSVMERMRPDPVMGALR